MPKFFYGIIFSIVLLLLLYTFTKPSLDDHSNSESQNNTEQSTEDTSSKKEYPVIVLDAGHGGFDRGSQVQGRVRGASQGRAERDREIERQDNFVHRRDP